MTRRYHPFAALLGLSVIALSGCMSNGPSEETFVKNAKDVLQGPLGRESSVCLAFPSMGDYTSFTGGLPRGWTALLDSPASAEGYEGHLRRTARPKLEALAQAGLLSKEPVELVRDGKPAAATRYLLTDKGREALASSDSAGACLQVGAWQAKGLVAPRSGLQQAETPELITRKTEGELTTYEAHVRFELQGAPEWASLAAMQTAYAEQLGTAKAGKTVRVELVKFNDKWVAKQVLAMKMAGSSRTPGGDALAAPREIPADLHEAALARLNAQASYPGARGASGGITLPVESASETPRELARATPGAVFLADKPDPLMQRRARLAQRMASLQAQEKNLANMPTETQAAMREMLARERASLTTPAVARPGESSTTDRYLNQRAELQFVLEALVEAGAYDKRTVARAEVPGTEQSGTLYTPRPGVVQSGSTIGLGAVRYSRIVEQRVTGAHLTVKVATEPLEVPAWATALAKKVPAFGGATSGTRTFLARPLESGEFPYSFIGL